MTSIFKATAILGSGSAVTLLMGLLNNKVYALLLGPEGVGLLGLFQSFLGMAVLLAGMGLSTGLVRLGSPLIEQETVKLIALRQAAWQIYWIVAGGMAVLLGVFARPLSQMLLAGSEAWTVFPMVVAMLFSLAAGIQIGLLTTYQRTRALARTSAFSSALSSILGMILVWLWGSLALPFVVLGLSLAQWGVSRVFLNRLTISGLIVKPEELRVARSELLKFGFPYTLSQMVGSAVQIGMPFVVLHKLGQEDVGYYRVAVLFSSAYVGFFQSALGQDFYPRLSSLKNQPSAFRSTLDIQQRFIVLMVGPLVALSLAFTPMLVAGLFSSEFLPTIHMFGWQLLGDLFKLVAWVCGFAVLAACSGLIYFATELIGGLLLLGLSWWGMQRYGLEGLGIGFLLTYMGYLALLVVVLKRELGWQPTLLNAVLFMLTAGVALMVKWIPVPFNYLLALSWAIGCGLFLWKQVMQGRSGSVGNV